MTNTEQRTEFDQAFHRDRPDVLLVKELLNSRLIDHTQPELTIEHESDIDTAEAVQARYEAALDTARQLRHAPPPMESGDLKTLSEMSIATMEAQRKLQSASLGTEENLWIDGEERTQKIDEMVDDLMVNRFGDEYAADRHLAQLHQIIRDMSIDRMPEDDWNRTTESKPDANAHGKQRYMPTPDSGKTQFSTHLRALAEAAQDEATNPRELFTARKAYDVILLAELEQAEQELIAAAVTVQTEVQNPFSAASDELDQAKAKLRDVMARRASADVAYFELFDSVSSADAAELLESDFRERATEINQAVALRTAEAELAMTGSRRIARAIGSVVLRGIRGTSKQPVDSRVITNQDLHLIGQAAELEVSDIKLAEPEAVLAPEPVGRTHQRARRVGRLAATAVAVVGLSAVSVFAASRLGVPEEESNPDANGLMGNREIPALDVDALDKFKPAVPERDDQRSAEQTKPKLELDMFAKIPADASAEDEVVAFTYEADEARGDGWIDLFISQAASEFGVELTDQEANEVYRRSEPWIMNNPSSYQYSDGTYRLNAGTVQLSQAELKQSEQAIVSVLFQRPGVFGER